MYARWYYYYIVYLPAPPIELKIVTTLNEDIAPIDLVFFLFHKFFNFTE